MIRIENLHISFGDKEILSGVSIDVEQGETVAVLGKNGCGKTLLLKAVAGLVKATSGAASCDSGRLAYVFQKGGLFDSMNVFSNVVFGLERMGIAEEEIKIRAEAALARVGLVGNELKLPSELSGGMQKRVGIARAICMTPDVILYDDPTAGLDPVLSDSMADLILEVKSSLNAASLVATHDLHVAEKIADRIVLLYGGVPVFYGGAEDFFAGGNPYARQFLDGDITGPIDIF